MELTIGSLFKFLNPLDVTLVFLSTFFVFWYKVFLAHLVHFLPQTWNLTFFQETLVCLSVLVENGI